MSDRDLIYQCSLVYDEPDIVQAGNEFRRITGYNEAMHSNVYQPWNPLEDDGDAFRLLTKLGIDVRETQEGFIEAKKAFGQSRTDIVIIEDSKDRESYRRAIVRVAALIDF